jgi:hypothetical protein
VEYNCGRQRKKSVGGGRAKERERERERGIASKIEEDISLAPQATCTVQ